MHLEKQAADVVYFDPHVKEYHNNKIIKQSEPKLTAELISEVDLVIVTTAHTSVDYDFVQKHAKVIFDTKNALKKVKNKNNVELL